MPCNVGGSEKLMPTGIPDWLSGFLGWKATFHLLRLRCLTAVPWESGIILCETWNMYSSFFTAFLYCFMVIIILFKYFFVKIKYAFLLFSA